jgi:F-type H+-transporting ATPase subunit alpha
MTRAQLTRGERMVEVLKQDQYVPMPLEDQVMIIFAGIHGYLDDLPAPAVRPFEARLLAYVAKEYPDLKHRIAESKQLPEPSQAKLREAIEKLKAEFVREQGAHAS